MLLLFSFAGLLAQEPSKDSEGPTRDYWYEERNGMVVFMQVLRWESVQYSAGYLLVMESKNAAGTWVSFYQTKTEKNYAVVSLPPGEYRYKITVFDILGKAAAQSDWYTITVQEAVQPVLGEISPSIIYLEERNTGTVTIEAIAVMDSTKLELRSLTKPGLVYPVTDFSVDYKKQTLKFQIPLSTIESGSYVLYAENPGGLYNTSGTMIIKFKKPQDLDVSAGYQMPVVLFDDTVSTYFNTSLIPLGATVKLTYIPFKRTFGFFGISAILTAARLQSDFEFYTLSTNYFAGYLNLVYQIPLVRQVLNLDVHAGAGVVMLYDLRFAFDNGIKSPDYSPWGVSYLAGVDLHWYPLRRMYVDLGFDFSISPMNDMVLGVFAPSLSAGWQF